MNSQLYKITTYGIKLNGKHGITGEIILREDKVQTYVSNIQSQYKIEKISENTTEK